MAFSGFTARIQRWRQRRRDERREAEAAGGAGGDDLFADFESAEAEAASGGESGSDRFERRRRVEYEMVFRGAARSSRDRHRTTGRFCDPLIADMLLDFWESFFECFREDEREFELERFREAAAEIQQALDDLPDQAPPDLVTCRQVLFLLSRFARQRFEEWNQRLDDLSAQQRALDGELQAVKLTGSWQTDELAYCRDLLGNAIRQRDVRVPSRPDGAPPTVSELLCALLGIQAQPPKPEAHTGRIERQRERERIAAESEERRMVGALERPRGTTTEAEGEGRVVHQALHDLLTGRATKAKLNRALEDEQLASALEAMAAEHRRNRAILKRIGLLPEE